MKNSEITKILRDNWGTCQFKHNVWTLRVYRGNANYLGRTWDETMTSFKKGFNYELNELNLDVVCVNVFGLPNSWHTVKIERSK